MADGAHNPDGVRVLARSLAAVRVPRPAVGVLAIMRDKDYPEMIASLLPLLDGVVCTQASEPRKSLPPTSWRRRSAHAAPWTRAPGLDVEAMTDPHAALGRARARAGVEGSVVIAGSLYLLEDLRDVLAGGVGAAPGLHVRIYWRKSVER